MKALDEELFRQSYQGTDRGRVRELLKAGADPNARADVGRSTIWNFALSGDVESFRLCAEFGGDVNQTTADGELAAWLRIANTRRGEEDRDFVAFLVERGADLSARWPGSRRTILHFLAESSHASIWDAYIAAGADPNAIDRDGWTPLFVAAQHNFGDGVRRLLALGADPARRDEAQRTALLVAVTWESAKAVAAFAETLAGSRAAFVEEAYQLALTRGYAAMAGALRPDTAQADLDQHPARAQAQALRQAIVTAMRSGGEWVLGNREYATCTRYRNGRFESADYDTQGNPGPRPEDFRAFTSEADALRRMLSQAFHHNRENGELQRLRRIARSVGVPRDAIAAALSTPAGALEIPAEWRVVVPAPAPPKPAPRRTKSDDERAADELMTLMDTDPAAATDAIVGRLHQVILDQNYQSPGSDLTWQLTGYLEPEAPRALASLWDSLLAGRAKDVLPRARAFADTHTGDDGLLAEARLVEAMAALTAETPTAAVSLALRAGEQLGFRSGSRTPPPIRARESVFLATLARCQRWAGRPYWSARLLESIVSSIPPAYRRWPLYELTMAGGTIDPELAVEGGLHTRVQQAIDAAKAGALEQLHAARAALDEKALYESLPFYDEVLDLAEALDPDRQSASRAMEDWLRGRAEELPYGLAGLARIGASAPAHVIAIAACDANNREGRHLLVSRRLVDPEGDDLLPPAGDEPTDVERLLSLLLANGFWRRDELIERLSAGARRVGASTWSERSFAPVLAEVKALLGDRARISADTGYVECSVAEPLAVLDHLSVRPLDDQILERIDAAGRCRLPALTRSLPAPGARIKERVAALTEARCIEPAPGGGFRLLFPVPVRRRR